MKITFVLPVLDLTGGCRVVSIYAARMHALGHEVSVVVPKGRRRTLRQVGRDLIREGKLVAKQPQIGASHFAGLDVDVRFISWADAVEGNGFPGADVIVATWWETMEWVNAAPARCGAKAYFVQGHEVFPGLPLERVRATYRMSAEKVTIARWIADVLRDEYQVENVTIVPNAVDHKVFTSRRRARQDRPTVGFVYSPIAFKGADVALEAIRTVRSKEGSLRVIVFGAKEPEIDLPEYIEFHLRPAQSLIPELYRSCDVWVCASESEGFNLPAMEAMACGTPVVSTRTGWPEEAVVQGLNGYLVEARNPAAIAARILDVLDTEPEAWIRMSEAAQIAARRQTWEESTRLFEENMLRIAAAAA